MALLTMTAISQYTNYYIGTDVCPECGFDFHKLNYDRSNFCPGCGCKLRIINYRKVGGE